jgi:hypothetical protein
MPSAQTASPVQEAERRAWKYWFVDGLPNLLAGLICLLVSLLLILFFTHGYNRSPLLTLLACIGLGALFTVVIWQLRFVLEWLKSRITYPRSGYAPPPYFSDPTEVSGRAPGPIMLNLSGTTSALERRDSRQDYWFFCFFGIVILGGALLAAALIASHLLCAVAGAAVGLLAAVASHKDPRRAQAVVIGLFFAYGNIFIFLHDPQMEGGIYFIGAVGLALALDGAIALIRYLRRNPEGRA